MKRRLLRRIVKKTRRDRLRNVNVWRNLNVRSLNNKIETSQLQWFCRVCRTNDERDQRRAWESKPEGRKGRGWLRTKWEECRTNDLKKSVEGGGAVWARDRVLALDRTRWRFSRHLRREEDD